MAAPGGSDPHCSVFIFNRRPIAAGQTQPGPAVACRAGTTAGRAGIDQLARDKTSPRNGAHAQNTNWKTNLRPHATGPNLSSRSPPDDGLLFFERSLSVFFMARPTTMPLDGPSTKGPTKLAPILRVGPWGRPTKSISKCLR